MCRLAHFFLFDFCRATLVLSFFSFSCVISLLLCLVTLPYTLFFSRLWYLHIQFFPTCSGVSSHTPCITARVIFGVWFTDVNLALLSFQAPAAMAEGDAAHDADEVAAEPPPSPEFLFRSQGVDHVHVR